MRDSAGGTESRTSDSLRNFRHKSTRRHAERTLILWNELARELVHDARGDEFELRDVVPLCVRVVAIAVVVVVGGGVFVDVICLVGSLLTRLCFTSSRADSNKNGSYYYANDNGSKYYNSGAGYERYNSGSGSGWSTWKK